MPLDLEQLSSQIQEMAANFAGSEPKNRVAAAWEQFQTQDAAHIRRRLDDQNARPQWRTIAHPLSSLVEKHALPPCPPNFTVLASDGSPINPDRHGPLRFFIINTGYAAISYGNEAGIELGTQGKLFYDQDELYIEAEYQTLPIDGALFAAQMAVAEVEMLQNATTLLRDKNGVALRDGTLILFGLDSPGLSDTVRERFLGPFRQALQTFQDQRFPIASYISFPGSDDVINALRVGMCPDAHVVCARCVTWQETHRAACADLAMLEDRRLFDLHLQHGERSALFQSRQPVLKFYGNDHHVLFFYVNVGNEIGRVEVPRWVAEDAELLDRVHAVVMDQCQRGRGYPPALVEAHEQAVINMADREVVERMIEEAFAEHAKLYTRSMKDRSKRERGI